MNYLIIILLFTGMIIGNIRNIEKRKEIKESNLYKKIVNKYNTGIKEEDFIVYNSIQNIKSSIVMIILTIIIRSIEYYQNINISTKTTIIAMFIILLIYTIIQEIQKRKYYRNIK